MNANYFRWRISKPRTRSLTNLDRVLIHAARVRRGAVKLFCQREWSRDKQGTHQMQTNAEKLADVETNLRRWHRRLTAAVNKITRLERQRRRLSVAPPPPPSARAKPITATVPTKLEPVTPIKADELEIPAFCNRADPVIAERMTAARKAAEADERRKMPLTGRAALAAIRAPAPKRKAAK
jgi:hypothetical protein